MSNQKYGYYYYLEEEEIYNNDYKPHIYVITEKIIKIIKRFIYLLFIKLT